MAQQNDEVASIIRSVRAARIARATAEPAGAFGSAPVDAPPAPGDHALDARLDDGLDDRLDGAGGIDDESVRAALVEDHLWLVDRLASQAARRFPRYIERNELWSAGVLGLVEAARRYDPSYGVPFAAFASARVRGEMLEVARSGDLAPRRLRRNLRELAVVVDDLTQQLGRVPTLKETADAAGIDVDAVRTRLQNASNLATASLDDDRSVAQNEQALSNTHSEPSERLSQQELIGAVREAVSQLPEPLKTILVRSHWNNERLVDIADDMGISFQRVAQYRVEAITALAAWFATLYEAVPRPDPSLPGSVRRAAFCANLATRSTWQIRLDAGQSPTMVEASSELPEPAPAEPVAVSTVNADDAGRAIGGVVRHLRSVAPSG